MTIENRIVRMPEIMRRTGFGRSSIYHLIKRGEFPPLVKIGARASGISSEVLDAWINEKLGASAKSGRAGA